MNVSVSSACKADQECCLANETAVANFVENSLAFACNLVIRRCDYYRRFDIFTPAVVRLIFSSGRRIVKYHLSYNFWFERIIVWHFGTRFSDM